MTERRFAKWADDVDDFKRHGDLAKALLECRKNYPFPYAFNHTAIVIRKQIRQKRKTQQDFSERLAALYSTAVCEDFFASFPWTHVLDNRLCSITAQPFVERIMWPYRQIGYKNLNLLNVTDKKWIVQLWGEPDSHTSAKDANRGLWQEAVEEFSVAAKKSQDALWRSHGLEPLRRDNAADSTPTTHRGTGCLLTLFFVAAAVVAIALIGQ